MISTAHGSKGNGTGRLATWVERIIVARAIPATNQVA
jgi:hypothetical protein